MLLLSFVYLLKLGRISDDKHALIKIYLELCHYIIYICIYYEGCDLRNNNRIGVVMVSVLISNGVDRGFVHRSDQTKTITLVSVVLRKHHYDIRKKEQSLVGSETGKCVRMELHVYNAVLFHWVSTIKI